MISTVSASILLASLAACSDGSARTSRAQPATPKPEELQWTAPGLSSTGNSFLIARNRHDAAALAALWHEDGDFMNASGRVARGRAEIEKLVRDELEETNLELLCAARVRFVNRAVRIEDWDVRITGKASAPGLLPPPQVHLLMMYAQNGPGSRSEPVSPAASPPQVQGDEWLLASVRAYVFQEPAWPRAEIDFPETVYRVGGPVTRPEPVSTPPPVYTEVARRAGVEGTVLIEAIIDEHGDVTTSRVLKALPLGLDPAALKAVQVWKFKPATVNGKPVKAFYTLMVPFRLPSKRSQQP